MKIDGRCHCGYISYEAEIDPDTIAICNCTDCQSLSGSAFRTVVPTKKGSFKLLSGELKLYVKTAENGNKRPQSFCPNCGSPIYSTSTDPDPKVHSLRVGTVRQRDQLAPKLQYWQRSAQRWTPGNRCATKLRKAASVSGRRWPRRQDRALHSRYARGFAGLCGLRGGLYSSQME